MKITNKRVRQIAAALEEEKKVEIDVMVPLIRHTCAKEYGWSYQETDALTLKEVHQAMTLIGEDIAKRSSQ